MLKTRMQSFAGNNKIAVGHQHAYVKEGLAKSLVHVYKSSGIKGLWAGAGTSTLRTGVGIYITF